MFLVLGGRATSSSATGRRWLPGRATSCAAGRGSLLAPREPQITTPSGFEKFAAAAGDRPALDGLPDPGPADPGALAHAAH